MADNKKLETTPGEVLAPDLAEGKPTAIDQWRTKLPGKARMLKYLKTGERYWYGESFGSERRKTEA